MPASPPAALAALRAAPWPGNVRQLRNEIERAVILCDGGLIETLSVAAPAAAARSDEGHRRLARAALPQDREGRPQGVA